MITILITGLDPFVVGHYSKENTANVANLFETSEDNVSFLSSENVLIHNGVEQTSWNALVEVKAPKKFASFEQAIADYLMSTLSSFAIHIEVNFVYYDDRSYYAKINDMYPRFIQASQVKDVTLGEDPEAEEDDASEEPDEGDRAELDRSNPEEIFLGDAFEGFDERIAAATQEAEDKK